MDWIRAQYLLHIFWQVRFLSLIFFQEDINKWDFEIAEEETDYLG
jgi:hypothetical protein